MRLSKINNLLLALIILINGYVIVAPLAPGLFFNARSQGPERQKLSRQLHPAKSDKPTPSVRPNHVVIPSMLLDQPVLEGPVRQQYATLNRGIWHWPTSSTPDKGGNTVLIGHRFTYTNPRGVFYFLNKVAVGDEIGLFWGNREHLYKVSEIKEVPPTDTSIQQNTSDSRLTLFTCSPLWLPKNRLVVVAKEVQP